MSNIFYYSYGGDAIEAGKKFFILDERGLITKARSNLLELEENFYDLSTFAEDDTTMEGNKTAVTKEFLMQIFFNSPTDIYMFSTIHYFS